MTRVALDLLGEGVQPESVLEALPAALDADPELVVTLVVAPGLATHKLAELGIVTGDRVRLVTAARGIRPGVDAVRDVRAYRDSGVRVAARLVRDGQADALVSTAPPEAVAAAAQFTFGLVPGSTRASLATVIGRPDGGAASGVVLCDSGASADVTADDLAQFALAAVAFARVRAGVGEPRVGLLTARPAVPDTLRRAAHELLGALGLDYVGPVDAGALVRGGLGATRAHDGSGGVARDGGLDGESGLDGAGEVDVVVTDGFTGDVILTALRAFAGRAPSAGTHDPAGMDPAWHSAAGPDLQGGTIVLGVDAVAVRAGESRGGPDDLATGVPAALATAATLWRGGLVAEVRAALAGLVTRRRAAAGLAP